MRAVTYRFKETGQEYTPPAGTFLAQLYAESDAWEPTSIADVDDDHDDDEGEAADGGAAGEGSTADEGTAPEFAAVYDPGEVGRTADEVNEYLDGHPEAVPLVIQLEAEGKARKTVLHGRHGTPEPADS